MSLRAQLICPLYACNIANKASWADPWYRKAFFRTHVPNGTTKTRSLVLKWLIGTKRAQRKISLTVARAIGSSRTFQNSQIVVAGKVETRIDCRGVCKRLTVEGEIYAVVRNLNVNNVRASPLGPNQIVVGVRKV
jgi:hypothetical protein